MSVHERVAERVTELIAERVVVRGVVQGVGFRPFVVHLAESLRLAGSCHNDTASVVIEVEGEADGVAEFVRRLRTDAPPLARITAVDTEALAPAARSGFSIGASTAGAGVRTSVPPDTAVCADCLAELADPADRRYRHPFITCTSCGPRHTIIEDLPYDRPATTMAGFAMCPACAVEYDDPADRRHHAQPIACPDCGPTLSVTDRHGTVLASGTEASLAAAIAALWGGAIVAIKGIGGYHLACDATSCTAASVLRERKQRPDQPFAVMVADLRTAGTLVEVGGAGPTLTSPERPIVLLPRRVGGPVADCVAPGLDELGVVLPYAPLHHLLLSAAPDGTPGAPSVLVMTSGNLSGEPLCFEDADARERLGAIADLFLTHDRPIAVPCEDSVLAWSDAGPVPLRRSRGFAPLPISLGSTSGVVLATGAEVKNTIALSRDGLAFVSGHLGDLESLESRAAQERAAAQLVRFHGSSPDLVVVDRHPGYASRAWGRRLAADLGVASYDVQHHHAHLAALAAEHGRLADPVLGIVFDGTGYGCDAGIWGGELLLLGDGGLSATRVGHLGTVRLPGGDAGVRHPVRTAALALLAAGGSLDGTPLAAELSDAETALLAGLAVGGEGWVATSSVGRLFDVVSALLGIRGRITYEAQAAIELEAAARRWRSTHGPGAIRFDLPVLPGVVPRLDPDPLVLGLAHSVRAGAPVEALAWAFHVALARAAGDLALALAAAHEVSAIGLTGGVFGNRILLELLRDQLTRAGAEVLTHRLVPANDGGLSLGQVAVGARYLSQNPGQHESQRESQKERTSPCA